MKSKLKRYGVTLGAVTALAAALSGCGASNPSETTGVTGSTVITGGGVTALTPITQSIPFTIAMTSWGSYDGNGGCIRAGTIPADSDQADGVNICKITPVGTRLPVNAGNAGAQSMSGAYTNLTLNSGTLTGTVQAGMQDINMAYNSLMSHQVSFASSMQVSGVAIDGYINSNTRAFVGTMYLYLNSTQIYMKLRFGGG